MNLSRILFGSAQNTLHKHTHTPATICENANNNSFSSLLWYAMASSFPLSVCRRKNIRIINIWKWRNTCDYNRYQVGSESRTHTEIKMEPNKMEQTRMEKRKSVIFAAFDWAHFKRLFTFPRETLIMVLCVCIKASKICIFHSAYSAWAYYL